MNEARFAAAIRHRLDGSLKSIDAPVATQLARARDAALARHARAASASWMTAGNVRLAIGFGPVSRPLFAALAVALVAIVAVQWRAGELVTNLTDVDSALLVDDMPVDALLDKGFEAWLADSQ